VITVLSLVITGAIVETDNVTCLTDIIGLWIDIICLEIGHLTTEIMKCMDGPIAEIYIMKGPDGPIAETWTITGLDGQIVEIGMTTGLIGTTVQTIMTAETDRIFNKERSQKCSLPSPKSKPIGL
jgi:hypothetical protein